MISKLFASISAAMAIFTLFTPASVFLRAKITLMENETITALLRAGEKLAMGQHNRLLTTNEIENVYDAISKSFIPSLLLAALCLMTVFVIFKTTRSVTLAAAAVMILSIVPLYLLNYQGSVPFLILSSLALLSSLSINTVFELKKH